MTSPTSTGMGESKCGAFASSQSAVYRSLYRISFMGVCYAA